MSELPDDLLQIYSKFVVFVDKNKFHLGVHVLNI